MKWMCDKCEKKDGSPPCVLQTDDTVSDDPSWCPFALDPVDEDSYPEWKGVESPKLMIITPSQYDPVNRPSHYTEGRNYEPIDVIEDWELDFCLGNALKYISRVGRKDDALQDLKKAKWYIERKIKQLE